MARIREGQQAYNAAYYQANRDRIRANQAAYQREHRSRLRAARKGLSADRVEAMLAEQQGRCAICPTALVVPHIDHDHRCCPGTTSCGACVRGLLCASCNHMLGKAHDTPEVLEAGAAYLRRYEGIQ